MPIMTNAEAFHYDFGIYATELLAMSEDEFLAWLNASCERERPKDMIVRCKDCKWWKREVDEIGDYFFCAFDCNKSYREDFFCADGERKDGEK